MNGAVGYRGRVDLAQLVVRRLNGRRASFDYVTDSHLMLNCGPEPLIDRIPQIQGITDLPREITALLWYWWWATDGMIVLQPTHSLLASLVLTDFGAVTFDDLRWPMRAMCVLLPPDLLRMHIGGAERTIRTIALTKFVLRRGDGAAPENFYFVEAQGDGPDGDQFRSLLYGAEPGEKIAPVLHHLKIEAGDGDLGPCDVAAAAAQNGRACAAAGKIAFGLIAWLASQPASAAKQLAGLDRQRASTPAPSTLPSVWTLGREVVVGRETRDAARALIAGQLGEGRAAWKLARRFVVRGHWRRQACGPLHAERRLMWIEPYWKGPDGGIGLVRNYTDARAGSLA